MSIYQNTITTGYNLLMKKRTLVRVVFTTIIFFITLSVFGQARRSELHIRENDIKPDSLSEYYTYWLQSFDEKESVVIADSFFKSGAFKHPKLHKSLNLGDARKRLWLRIVVKNDCKANTKFVWTVRHFLDTANLYMATDSSFKQVATGSFWDISSKRLINARQLCLPFTIQKNQSVVLYLCINQHTGNLFFRLHIRSILSYYQLELKYMMTNNWRRLIGFYIFSCIFILILYSFLKQKLYLWYCIYVILNTIFLLMEDSLDGVVLPQWIYSFIWHTGQYSFLLLSSAVGIKIMQLFIDIDRKQKILYEMGVALIALSFLFVPFIFIIQNYYPHHNNGFSIVDFLKIATDILIIANSIFILIAIIIYAINRRRMAIYYGITYLFFFLSCLRFTLNHQGITTLDFMKRNNFALGLFFQLLLLIILLIRNFRSIIQRNLTLKVANIQLENSLLKNSVEVQETERKRIAEDLHDGVGSELSSINLLITNHFIQHPVINDEDTIYRAQLAKQLDKLLIEVREVAHDLMPQNFNEKGIIEILIEKIDYLNATNTLTFELLFTGDFNYTNKQVQIACYRIILELLTNIIKHSKATKATLQLYSEETYLQIIVEDNGIGLHEINDHKGIGLQNIRSRISALQGTINFDSSKFGTTIIIEVPIQKL